MHALQLPSLGLTLSHEEANEWINQYIEQQVAALGHIVHVRASDVTLRIDAENPKLSQLDYDALLRFVDTKLFFRRAAHFDRAYA